MSDGRASLWLEFYLGRSESPVYDDDGNPVLYESGAMKGKPKYRVKHLRKKEAINLYVWLHPRTAQERQQNKNTLQLAEKIRFEKEQEMLEDRKGYRIKREKVSFLTWISVGHRGGKTGGLFLAVDQSDENDYLCDIRN